MTVLDLNEDRKNIIMKERQNVARIFKMFFEFVEVLPNFHIYAIDCRGEYTLKDTLLRIDKLMGSDIIKRKEVVKLPKIFAEAIGEVRRSGEELENIIPEIDSSCLVNMCTGCRDERSYYMPEYSHHISWVGIIMSPALKDMSKSDDFIYYLKNCGEFMKAFVPADEKRFLDKVELISSTISEEQSRELEQFIEIARLIRNDIYSKYSAIIAGKRKNTTLMSNDMYYIYGDDLRLTPKIKPENFM